MTWLLLSACNPTVIEDSYNTDKPPSKHTDSGITDSGDTDDTDDTDTDDTDTDDSGDTDDPDTTPQLKSVDCSDLPAAPLSVETVPGARGYHGLAFDEDGLIIGSDNSSLVISNRDGDWDILTPSIGWTEQFDSLPDGDIAVLATQNSTIKRISSKGASSELATSISGYGLTTGPDGMIYVANYQDIIRIDPDTGEKTELLGSVASTSPKVVDFSVDHATMYYGSLSGGRVFSVTLDEDMNPTGQPEVFAVGVGGWHDGIGVDVCGNVYVADYNTTSLFKITPDGTVSTYYDYFGSSYGHGLVWGSGKSGFREDALYVPQPYDNNKVLELVIGVPRRGWDGEVLNAPK
ncbi:MAG: hypothetical protein ACI8RZ_003816 [Myxococcota bacterium]|jgi:hypothetical protein